MPYNSKQIKISTNEKGKTLVKVGHFRTVESRIVFSFSFFNGKSIRINDFNNRKLGGTMPEELPTPKKSIKELQKEQSKITVSN